MGSLWQDTSYALRTLRRNVTVTLLAVASLALAVAGNTTVFSFVNSMLYRPLPYAEPERLEFVSERHRLRPEGWIERCSAANYLDYLERQTSFEELVAIRLRVVGLDVGEEPKLAAAAEVSVGLLDMLGVEPIRGRNFVPEEAVPGRHRVVVITHELWVERFGSREDLVGNAVMLDGMAYDVVGVLGKEFDFLLNSEIRAFMPLVLDRDHLRREERDLIVLGRRAEGRTSAEAQAELRTIMAQLAREHPEANRDYLVEVLNLREEFPDPVSRTLFTLFQAALAFVLLIACSNIANLLLARSQAREREIAVRTSLGAGQWRIVRQLLTESLVLSFAAGLVGLALAAASVKLFRNHLAGQYSKTFLPEIDLQVLLFTLGITMTAGLVFGIAPAIHTRRIELVTALKDGGHGATAGRGRRRTANALVVAQIALALVCVGGASTAIRSFLELRYTDPGFVVDENLLTVEILLPEARYPDDGERVRRMDELLERLRNLPGVDGAMASALPPRSLYVKQLDFTVDDRPPEIGGVPPRAYRMITSPGFFKTLGIPLRRGRLFTEADRDGTNPVAVISEAAAERYWDGQDPLGERLTIDASSHVVVGVVGNVRHGLALRRENPATVYLPWRQQPTRHTFVSLRARSDPGSLAERLHEEIRHFDPKATAPIQTLGDYLDKFYVDVELYMTFLGILGSLAFLLAALGTFGVLGYSVALRTQEIGMRMVMGAGHRRILRLIVGEGLLLLGLGLLLGLPLMVLVLRKITSLLANYMPVEPSTTIAAGILLAVTTVLASVLPAHRAATVEPIEALRCE